jgi:hypothetical protein
MRGKSIKIVEMGDECHLRIVKGEIKKAEMFDILIKAVNKPTTGKRTLNNSFSHLNYAIDLNYFINHNNNQHNKLYPIFKADHEQKNPH